MSAIPLRTVTGSGSIDEDFVGRRAIADATSAGETGEKIDTLTPLGADEKTGGEVAGVERRTRSILAAVKSAIIARQR
jgi:hypothetical protein